MPSSYEAVVQLDPIETRDHGVYADGDGTLHFTETKPAQELDKIQWVPDVDRRLELGDRVRGVLELTIELPGQKPYEYSSWVAELEKHPEDFEKLWNAKLAEKGEATAFKVVALRESRYIGHIPGEPNKRRLEVEVVARVTHNGAILWVAFAVLVTALTANIVHQALYGANIIDVDGKALAYSAGEAVGGFAAGVAKPLLPIAAAAFLLWSMVK